MTRQLVALLSAIAIASCTDMGQEPSTFTPPPTSHTWTIPGVVGVFFKPGITIEQATQLVKDLNLEFKSGPSGDPVNGLISVPVGTEDQWVAEFKTFSIVKSSDRVWVTEVDCRMPLVVSP